LSQDATVGVSPSLTSLIVPLIVHFTFCVSFLTVLILYQATTKKFEEEGVDDLVLLPKVTNQGIMANLEKRYKRDLIYVCSLLSYVLVHFLSVVSLFTQTFSFFLTLRRILGPCWSP
jgi:hypothetical protein